MNLQIAKDDLLRLHCIVFDREKRFGAGTYLFSAGVTVFRIEGLIAGAAVWPALSHDVTLTAQCCLALKTGEVFHVPEPPFCLCAFVCKNNLGWTHRPKRAQIKRLWVNKMTLNQTLISILKG